MVRRGLVLFLLLCSMKVYPAIERIPAGSFIINLGVLPQTKENALKPYGLVYALLKNHQVPVKWVINPTKGKDGVDFTYNGTAYRGGSFIILAQYRTLEINNEINAWKNKGVIGENIAFDLNLPVYAVLSYAPRWTIDKVYGSLVLPFFQNAEIPASAYGGNTSNSWKNPADLTECDDIFVLPHADPQWDTHKNLVKWNKDYKGAIWSGCHAVSVMESLSSPDGLTKMNFLTLNGLVNYNSHWTSLAPPPFLYSNAEDPIMQFMGVLDVASYNGSERVYLPKIGGGWRPGVKTSVIASAHPQIPALSAGPAAVMAYGRGFDDPANGWVMYQGGHYHNGVDLDPFTNTAQPFGQDHIALQRAFFNFSFLSVIDRQTNGVSATIIAEPEMNTMTSHLVSFATIGNADMSKYQISWSASAGQIKAINGNSMTFIPPADPQIKIVLLTLMLTDACGRKYFTTKNITLKHCAKEAAIFSLASREPMQPGHPYKISINSTSQREWEKYTIEWVASSGKILLGENNTEIQFIPSLMQNESQVRVDVKLTDLCGNVYQTYKYFNTITKKDGEVSVPNLVSANADGYGYDFLYITNIEKFPNNEIIIYNRWGGKVYEQRGYDNTSKVFTGLSNIGSEKLLLDGVYFYVLKLNGGNNVNTQNAINTNNEVVKGYFILKR